jgi:hypothetical protein
MSEGGRIQDLCFMLGLPPASALLFKFALDFSSQGILLAAAFWALVAASLAAIAANALRPGGRAIESRPARALLLAAMPLAFLASSLDCTGLELRGCTRFCTFIKVGWVPLLAAACALHFWVERRALLMTIYAMTFVPLVPHCACYNPANRWWIDRIGASPECYSWGFVASLVSITALAGGRARLSIAICYAIIGGAAGFFIAHHYFKFPW